MEETYAYKYFPLTDMKGEQRGDIPHLDGAYRISNYGRIKTVKRWVQITTSGGGYWPRERICRVRVATQLRKALKFRENVHIPV